MRKQCCFNTAFKILNDGDHRFNLTSERSQRAPPFASVSFYALGKGAFSFLTAPQVCYELLHLPEAVSHLASSSYCSQKPVVGFPDSRIPLLLADSTVIVRPSDLFWFFLPSPKPLQQQMVDPEHQPPEEQKSSLISPIQSSARHKTIISLLTICRFSKRICSLLNDVCKTSLYILLLCICSCTKWTTLWNNTLLKTASDIWYVMTITKRSN